MDLFMADDDRGDENVRRFSTQLSDSGAGAAPPTAPPGEAAELVPW